MGYRVAVPMAEQAASTGRVLEVSRRYVALFSGATGIVTGMVSSKALDVVVGDLVTFEGRDDGVFVTGVLPASRSLYRSYRGSLKRMGANIDLLCVIAGVGQVLNPVVVDRMLVAAKVQLIPALLVVNKSDLGVGSVEAVTSVYRSIGVDMLFCSAKHGDNLNELERRVGAAGVRVAALCGVSGVGKSTILNRLVPGAKARTGEVSARTGQGKQTTTQPRAFLADPTGGRIIIDFPGVQFFGLSHVAVEQVAAAFPEFVEASARCRFSNCRHLKEPGCAVRSGIDSGEIARWRYDSYLQIVEEIEEAREY